MSHITYASAEEPTIHKQTINKPDPMNTIDLLVEAAKRLNFHSGLTSRLAQRMYINGIITYPRTSSRKYNTELQIEKILASYAGVENYEQTIKNLLNKTTYDSCFLEHDDYQDHPPITPNPLGAGRARVKAKSETGKLHDLVMRYFFASIHDDAVINQVTTPFKIGEQCFTEMHSFFTHKGFTEIYDLDKATAAKFNISETKFDDDRYKIESLKVEKYIEPLKEYLTEAELIKKMEEHKIGTDGSIPNHIKKIIYRNYVNLITGEDKIKRFKPTPLGLALAEGFGMIDQELIKPIVRNHIER
jgi:DNA topoisomerase IA